MLDNSRPLDNTLELILNEQGTKNYTAFTNLFAPEISYELRPKKTAISENGQKILVAFVKKGIELYGPAQRKLGGLYINHPWTTARVLADLDADLDVIIAAYMHDVTDLAIKKAQKNSSLEDERAFAHQYLADLMKESNNELERFSVPQSERERFIGSLHEILRVNIGLKDESPYRLRGDIFRSSEALKAALVKFSDDLCNTWDLDRPNGEEPSLPLWLSNLIDEQLSFKTIDELENKLNIFITPLMFYLNQLLPEEKKNISLKGAEKIKKIYKNISLINIKPEDFEVGYTGDKHIPILKHLETNLVSASKIKAREHAEHMIRKHIHPYYARHSLNLLREYEGFNVVTPSHKYSPFDGMFGYFDQMIKGDEKAIDAMNENKKLQFKAIILLWKHMELFEEDPSRRVQGLDESGLIDVVGPVMVRKPFYSVIGSVAANASKLLFNL
ncbi:MAG: hypothetical protein V1837_05060 [Candidatus Woesearchaeota archaeon]